MDPQLWATCELYQLATVTPDAFSLGEPPPSGPKPTKIATTASSPTGPIHRLKLESFIAFPPFRPWSDLGSETTRDSPETLARTLLTRIVSAPDGRRRWVAPTRFRGVSTPSAAWNSRTSFRLATGFNQLQPHVAR